MDQQSDNVLMVGLPLLSEEELAVAHRKTQEISCQDDEPEELHGFDRYDTWEKALYLNLRQRRHNFVTSNIKNIV